MGTGMGLAGYFLGVCLLAAPGDTVLAEYPMNSLSEINVLGGFPSDFSVEMEPGASQDGAGSFKVTYRGTSSAEIALFEVPLAQLRAATLWYRAWVRTDTPDLKAYLQMFCTLEDGVSYFSRAVAAPVGKISGKGDWALSQTPFYLKPSNRATRATLGLRFEGPGTVWIDHVTLVKEAAWMGGSNGGWLGLSGGLFGAVLGLWGALAGTLTSKGRGRPFVLISGALLLMIGLVSLVLGICLFLMGGAHALWYPLLLIGGITAVVMIPLLFGSMRRYRSVEQQRMTARDRADSL